MPTYEYECTACEHRFEKFQSITASAARKCPECGKLKLRRLIGKGSGIIFRGSGFYQTDYRSSGYAKEAGAEAKASSASSSDSATSTGETSPSKSSSQTKSASAGKAAG